jgi:predicted AAA+ superfamily ATPase
MYHKNQVVDNWFWRDSAGNEIDLVYSENKQLITHEIKSSATVLNKHMKGLNYFEKKAENRTVIKKMIYTGNEHYVRQNCEMIPWHEFTF